MEKDRFPVFMKLLIWWWEDNQTKISDIDKCCAEAIIIYVFIFVILTEGHAY